MPTYVYKFLDSGETVEVQQAFTDDTLTELTHPTSGEVLPVKKVFTPVGVTFKGSGFFKTDNRGKSSATETASSDSKSGDSKSGDSKSGEAGRASKSTTDSSGSSGDSTTKKVDAAPPSSAGKPPTAAPAKPSANSTS
jgi:predicted nucleic acid-binding Zn ribbon protein